MEKTSDAADDIMKSDKLDLMNYPHIIDELAEWSINLDSKLSADNSYSVALDLLRCRNISLSSVHPSSLNLSSDDKLPANKESDSSSLSKINYLLYNTWRKLSDVLTFWFPPSQVLVTYAHLRENNCPWQLGYLSSESVQGQALCLVATHWLELMELPNRLQSSNSSSLNDLKQSNDITPFELIQSPNISSTYVESDVNQIVTNHSTRITRKWYLSYVDPCPQWRIVTFLSYKPSETFEYDLSANGSNSTLDNLYYITAIGYSNGSIDIIDLSIDESERPNLDQNIRRSRIFIPSPFTQSIDSLGYKKPLFPIVLLSFIDISHLLVGHFRGHVDLWHLDWKAKSFPARMMMRIYSISTYKASKPPPLLSAVYDSSSSLLVLSCLPNVNVSVSKSMHRKLGLSCYYVSKKAPYLIPASSSSTSDVIPGGLMSLYSAWKDTSVHLLCNLFRRNSYLTCDNTDAITSMTLANFSTTSLPIFSSSDISDQLLLGSLHSSGSYSVWLIPSFELLLLIANPQSSPNVSLSPVNEASSMYSRPFRIAWWGRPSESDELLNQTIQLCVLHENGSIDLLDIKKCGTEFYPKIARKLESLKLSKFPVFATHSTLQSNPQSCLSEVVLLSSCLKEDSESNIGNIVHHSSKTMIFHHCIRCTRLKSTTYHGLFDHYIRIGKFYKALELNKSNKKINNEIVYKQMWIRLSNEFWKINNFQQFLHSTLDPIQKIHPLWIIKQCLNYLPKFVPFNLNYTLLLSNIQLVLNYGLNLLINNKHLMNNNLWYSTIHDRFLTYLAHIHCIELIIKNELQSDSSMNDELIHLHLIHHETYQPCVEEILEFIGHLRIHSLLFIALNYANHQQFIALNTLIDYFPKSIGLYRLLIGSHLSETINPNLYFNKLFNLQSISQNNQTESIIDIQNDHYNEMMMMKSIQCNFSISLYLNVEILNNPLKLVKIFSSWFIERAIQIDTRSGLTNYALNLISMGLSMCEEMLKGNPIDHEIEICLKSLRKVHRDFIELAQIIYNKNISPTTTLQISNDFTSMIPQECNNNNNNDSTNECIRAFQLKMKNFQHFDSKFILTLLLRISLNLINSDNLHNTSSSSVNSDQLVSFVVYQLLPHLAEKCSPSNYQQLINHCLLYAANYIGLTGHLKLLESVKLGSLTDFSDYLSINLTDAVVLNNDSRVNDYLTILNPYRLLNGLVYVLKEYELDHKVDQLYNQEPIVSLSTYLNTANQLIQSMLIYCQDYKMIILQFTNEIDYKNLLESIQLINQFILAFIEFQSLIQSIEKCIGSSIQLPFNSIGSFYRCSQDAKYFYHLLNNWMQIFSRLAMTYEYKDNISDELIHDSNHKRIQRSQISESTIKKLNDTFCQFYKILSKAFHHCPSESWLEIGLQYTLFASGNEYFLELSRNFCLNFNESRINLQKTIELSENALNTWRICLLNAIRTYVNTSVPIRSDLKMVFTDCQTSSSSLSSSNVYSNRIIDPNERLARHCLSIIDSLHNQMNWNQSFLLEFHIEKCLLDASTFLGTIHKILSPSMISSSYLPYKLRYLWCTTTTTTTTTNNNNDNNQSNELCNKRIDLLIDAFNKLIKLFSIDTKTNYDNNYLKNLFNSILLHNIANSFLINTEQVKRCFIHSMYHYIKLNTNDDYPNVYLLHLTYNYLNDLIELRNELCWHECAHWAGYESELYDPSDISNHHHYTTHINSSSNNTIKKFDNKLYSWTYLHALYNIERSKYNFTNMNIDIMELWNVERYRLRLARYALAYCKSLEYLYDLCNFIGLCTLRLEWITLSIIMLNNNKKEGSNIKKLSRNMYKQLVKLISSEYHQLETENNNKHDKGITLCLPPYYSESTNDLFTELRSNIFDELEPINYPNYGLNEQRLWFAFLIHWAKLNQINIFNDHDDDCNPNIIWCKTFLEVMNRDTRLAISYSVIGSKCCRFYSSNSMSYLNYINQVSSVLLPFMESSSISENFDSTCRIVLVLLCYILISVYEYKTIEYCLPCGCFPSGKYLCSKYCSFITSNEFSQEFNQLHKQLIHTLSIVLRESLIHRLVSKFPSIDFVRFHNDQNYREDTIYGLCSTNFSLGLRLCSCYNLSQIEGIFCRLEYLFRDEDCTNDKIKKMINYIIQWILTYPNGMKILIHRIQHTIYPFLIQLSQIKLFFDVLPNECDLQVFDSLQIQLHRKILGILSKLNVDDTFFNCISYPEFLNYLHQSSELHNYPLFNFIKTKSDADVVAKIVEQLQTDDNSNEITSLQVGDIYAIFGLRVFYDLTLFESFKNMSDLLKLFELIAPDNTSNDVSRFVKWLDELLYDSTFSENLSISQRRLVLKSAHSFVSRLNQPTTEMVINNYVLNFNQILYLLNNILFPQENTIHNDQDDFNEIDLNKNFINKFLLPKEFYSKLISIKPTNQLAKVNFFKELIFTIINNPLNGIHQHSNNDMSSHSVCLNIATKLQILGCLLPHCLKTLNIENEIWLNILQENLSICFSLLSSIFTLNFEYFSQININQQQQEQISTQMFTNSQVQLIYPHLNDFLNLFIKNDDDDDDPDHDHDPLNDPYRIDSIELLTCLLSNITIRRLFGKNLLTSYSNPINDWDELHFTNTLTIFMKTLNYLQNSFNNSQLLLSEFNSQLSLLCIENDVNQFQNSIIQLFEQNLMMINSDDDDDHHHHQLRNNFMEDSFTMIKENVELLRSIIELIDLIIIDDILPDKCDFLQNLWILWYQYCEKSGIIFMNNELFNSELFMHQWTKFCIPPIEFTKAGLKRLSDYYTFNKSFPSYPITFQAALISNGLLQSNIDLINSTLSILSNITDNDSIIHYLDSYVCCYFICNHYKYYLNLINNSSTCNDPIISRKFFSKLFTSLINLLQSNYSNQMIYYKMGYNFCLLLRNENMWLEAMKIYRIIHRIDTNKLPIEYLMKLIHELKCIEE
ncbi:unnamed protein product [Schistosoma mattheei]|uniref:Uncharacterized protein n=1 Tax=Schistosoma mattheei TaxID=31246 RepID=A0AA85AQY2_9TREM|nr:unnamed protein product [Schistosoma mattheei]